jgi:hypothetical protein
MAEVSRATDLDLAQISPLQACESMIIVDVGETNTRALFFTVVEGRFRFISSGTSVTTVYAPYNHPGYGVRAALEELERSSGQTFVGEDGHIISPRDDQGRGVDGFSVIFSAGPPLRVVAGGLRADVSLESVGRLVDSIYAEIVGVMHLADGLAWEERGERLLGLLPDVIVLAGGYDGGAKEALERLLRPVDVACALLPKDVQPVVIFAGNPEAQPTVTTALPNVNELHIIPNIRPGKDNEQFSLARALMAKVLRKDCLKRYPGLKMLDGWAKGDLTPFPVAFGRSVRFLSLDDPDRSVLGIDLGTRKAVAALGYDGDVNLHVFSTLDKNQAGLVDAQTLREVMRWLYLAIPEEEVRDYLSNRMLFPGSLPATFKDLAIEQALARSALRKIANLIGRDLSRKASHGPENDPRRMPQLFDLEPIIASGGILAHAPNLAQAALMLLDGIQPAGITSLILDQNALMGAVGATMKMNPILAIQIMDSSALLNLGLVIAPACRVGNGEPVLRLRMMTSTGKDMRLEINQGEMRTLPLGHDEQAQLWLKPLNGADIGMGPGKGGRLGHVSGGALGLIIDCRGRPLPLAGDPDQRRERYKEWLRALRA